MNDRKRLSVRTLRIVCSYILVLLIPLIIACTLYVQAEKRILLQQQNSYISSLNQAMAVVDTQISITGSQLLNIVSDKSIKDTYLMKGELQNNDYYTLYQLALRLNEIPRYPNSSIQDIYLHYFNIDRIHTLSSPYSRYTFYNIASSMTQEQYDRYISVMTEKRYYNELKYMEIPIPGGTMAKKLVSLLTLPVGISEPCAVACMIIDTSFMETQLSTIENVKGGGIYIISDDGSIVAHSGVAYEPAIFDFKTLDRTDETKTVINNGNTYSISYVSSPQTGWKYVAVQPNVRIAAAIAELRRYLIISVSAVLFIGIILSVAFSKQNAYPIDYIAGILTSYGYEDMSARVSTKEIMSQVKKLLDHNQRMKEQIENVEIEDRNRTRIWNDESASIKELLLYQLLINSPGEKEYTLKRLEPIGIVFAYPLIQVLIIDTPNHVGAQIREVPSGVMLVLTRDLQNRQVCILNFPGDLITYVQSFIQLIAGEGKQVQSTIGVSLVHESIYSASDAYKEAQRALEYCYMHDRSLVSYEQIREIHDSYQYPIEIEWSLINAICAGNEEEAVAVFETLVQINMNKKVLSVFMIRNFMYEIMTTIVRTGEILHFDDSELLINPASYLTFDAFKEEAVKTIRELCQYSRSNKHKKSNVLRIEDIFADVKENCLNPQLSVNFLADKHSINPSYLSRFFKKETGMNLSEHIISQKMEKAKQLLSDARLSVQDIALRLGYSDATSFIKAFSKYTGMTPGLFRTNDKEVIIADK